MKAQILDSREEGESQCFLSRITLGDYIKGLPTTYQDYDVQREIVSNVYLDHLVDTVLEQKHIPPIVLVVEKGEFTLKDNSLEIREFKILDGLQRTFRIQAIGETIKYCLDKLDDSNEYLEWNKFKFSRQFSSDLRKFNSNTDVLRSVLNSRAKLGNENLHKIFSENIQWFEVWTGLTPDEEVRKMLTLNAGHKPVKTRHQLELLFLNLLPTLRAGQGENFHLVREKEVGSTQFSKGRQCGSFHFAHIISSLLSLISAKPITPSTNLIQSIQSGDDNLEEKKEFISPQLLKSFVLFLVGLDQLLSSHYKEIGVTWMGREVTLAGLFGALGAIAENTERSREEVMQQFLVLIRDKPDVLNLEQFEAARNSLDLSKVNIGNVNRTAVASAINSLFSQTPPHRIDWRVHFGVEKK